MEFDYYSPSETFVVLTADQFVGRDNGLLLNNSHAGQPRLSKKSHISSDFKEKSDSSPQRRRSLGNRE